MQELTQDRLKQEMTQILKVCQQMYATRQDMPPMLFAVLRGGDTGQVGVEAIPPQVSVLMAMGLRAQLVNIIKKMKASLAESKVELLGIIQAAEAWQVEGTTDDLAGTSTPIRPSERPDRVEILQVSAICSDPALTTCMIYRIERDDKGAVTGLRKQDSQGLEQIRSIFDEVFK